MLILSIIVGSSILAAKSSLTEIESFVSSTLIALSTVVLNWKILDIIHCFGHIDLHVTAAMWRGITWYQDHSYYLHIALNTDNIFYRTFKHETLVPVIITVID